MPIKRAFYVRRKSLILRLLVYGIGNGTFRNKCTIPASGHSAHRHYPRINEHVACARPTARKSQQHLF